MANAYVIPFDFNPVDTKEFQNLSYSYTVPAGKYAIVTYNLYATCGFTQTGGSITASDQINNDSNSVCGELRLGAGDVLTRSVSTPTSTTSTTQAAYTCDYTAELRVNGNAVASVAARAFMQKPAAGSDYTRSGLVGTDAHISEYNIAT
jgi:hypothetical protein